MLYSQWLFFVLYFALKIEDYGKTRKWSEAGPYEAKMRNWKDSIEEKEGRKDLRERK